MIAVTHNGSITDIAYILPICSWLEKNKNQKIVFVFPEITEDIQSITSLLKLQKFTHDVRFVKHNMGKYNPGEFINDIHFTEYYNFVAPIQYPEYITDFYATVNSLGVDREFVLNLDLDFKYSTEVISITKGLNDIFPNYSIIDQNTDMLTLLRELAYSRERHITFNVIATYLGLAKIPFYLYLFRKESGYYVDCTKEDFWLKLRDAAILDIRSFDSRRNIISYYDKIYFN
jgi:hypothetical protein